MKTRRPAGRLSGPSSEIAPPPGYRGKGSVRKAKRKLLQGGEFAPRGEASVNKTESRRVKHEMSGGRDHYGKPDPLARTPKRVGVRGAPRCKTTWLPYTGAKYRIRCGRAAGHTGQHSNSIEGKR